MKERICHECGDTLRGRADQKFCNDACRNTFNNKKLGETTRLMRRINRLLKKNHSILKDLNPPGKTTVYRSTLEKRGFTFAYYTHIYTTRKGGTYYFCYDQGYLELDSNKYLLVTKKE